MSDDMSGMQYVGNLAGSWVNCILITIELMGAAVYFVKYKPSRKKKVFGAIMLSNDIAQSVVVCVIAYLFLIGWKPLPTHHTWTTPLTIMQSYISCILEQLFLLSRFYSLSKYRMYSALVLCLCVIHTAFNWTSLIWISVNPAFVYSFGVTATTIASVTSAVADILIAGGMVFVTMQLSSITEPGQILLRRVAAEAMVTGSVTSAITLIKLGFQLSQTSPISYVLSDCVGRIYSLTVIVNLLYLKVRSEHSSGDNWTTSDTVTNSRGPQGVLTNIRFDDMGSINTDVLDYRENLALHSPGDSASDIQSSRRTSRSLAGGRKSEDIRLGYGGMPPHANKDPNTVDVDEP